MKLYIVGFTNIIGSQMYITNKRIQKKCGGGLFQSYNQIQYSQDILELLETRLLTSINSNLRTQLLFYKFFPEMKEFTNLLLQCNVQIIIGQKIFLQQKFNFSHFLQMLIDSKDKNSRESKFLQILYEILDNSNQDIIQWSESGFFISSVQTFKTNLLPQHFKHNKYSSFLRQLNKYGFLIKEKQKDSVKFIHKTINQNKRELKKQQLIKKQENTLNLKEEMVDMRQELIKLQKQQTMLKQQMEASKKVMSHLFNSMSRFIHVTTSTIEYSKAFSTMILSNLNKAIPNVSGDLLQHQLGAAKIAFPDFFTSTFVTPTPSLFGTPIPFYFSMLQELLFIRDNINNK